jgi:hypothetical protein
MTDTSTVPAVPAGVTAVMVPAFTTTTEVARTPLILTVAGATNPEPEIVTGVPPDVGPVDGEIPETTGPGTVSKHEACAST